MSKQTPRIRRIADLLWQVYSLVTDATPSQRRSLGKSLERLTETNCSWLLYESRPLLREMMRMAQSCSKGK